MKTKTVFNFIMDDWKRIKNHCRTTDGKGFTENEATDAFKKKLLISEHTPIRLLEFDWSWKGIKYWLSTEWSRHKFEKFISTQRNDRQHAYDRNEARQDTLVNFDGYANMQNLIDAWRKRLCYQADPEARALAEDFKAKLRETHPLESDVLVPNCVYRLGCPEFRTCGFAKHFIESLTVDEMIDIQKRYDKYNEMLYKDRSQEAGSEERGLCDGDGSSNGQGKRMKDEDNESVNTHAVCFNINTRMEEKGIDAIDLCNALNLPVTTIASWLGGFRQPTVYGLYRIAKVLGTTMDELAEGIEEGGD